MLLYGLVLGVVVLSLSRCQAGAELFHDTGFENSNPAASWQCAGCRLDRSTDHKSGQHSVKVSARQAGWAGVYQSAPLQHNTRYQLQAQVKQLNDLSHRLFQEYSLQMELTKHDGSRHYTNLGINRAMTTKSGWTAITANFIFLDTDVKQTNIRLNGPEKDIDFLVDDMSLTVIPENKNWKSEADKRIDQIRKNNIHFKVNLPSNVALADMEIQIDLTKHSFPFGSQTTWRLMENNQYDQLLFQMFNWATLSNYYWDFSPPPRERPNYSSASHALGVLHQHGIPVRGHNIFWAADKHTPDWVKALSVSQLNQEVDKRIQYIVQQTKGKVDHWDVMNELVHSHWYEEKTRDPDYSKNIFSKVHQADPNVKLFLNDYNVVSSGSATSAYLKQARSFKAANVGLYGLGIQCHFKEHQPPDPTLMKKNLDTLGQAGLPIWATEMDLVVHDENTRANWYDIALRMLFSHPSVGGIIFWGFWNGNLWRGPDAALVSGNNFNVNAAGRRYMDLISKEWSTHTSHQMTSGSQFTVRGFHGDYDVIVKYQGSTIKEQKFTLGKHDMTVNIDITDLNQNIHTTHPHTSPHNVAHIKEYALGHMTSGSSNQLTCISRYSAFSQVGDDKHVEVSCPSGYVLTGCSGQIKDHRDTRDGDMIVVVGGVAKCQTSDAHGSAAPVQAVARCCKLSGLNCEYRKSGPSENVLNQRIETTCRDNKYATGCTAHNYIRYMDGSFPGPSLHSCIAQNTDNHGGVESTAACCSAPNLTCHVKISGQSGDKVGDQVGVACDPGWELVGCTSYSDDARLGGAYLGGATPPNCIAVNGGQRANGEMGVVAYATCCRTH